MLDMGTSSLNFKQFTNSTTDFLEGNSKLVGLDIPYIQPTPEPCPQVDGNL